MIVMAENDSGVLFMSEALPKSHNGGGPIALDSAITSDEVDSDSEGGATALAAKSYLSSAETKRRNKRKNFQPRNIAYSESESVTESGVASFGGREATPSDSGESDYALDLSNADIIRSCGGGGDADADVDVSVKAKAKHSKQVKTSEGEAKGDAENEESEEAEGAIDLSCSKSTSPYPYNHVNSYYSDSDSDDAIKLDDRRRNDILESFKPPVVAPYFLHPLLGHGGDASELKEYFQNTVKEFLGIYGLNSDTVTDVAQTITNNVPISNFSSGKILESLSTTASSMMMKNRPSPKSEPPTPPRSPHSPISLKTYTPTSNSVSVTTPSSKSKADLSFTKQANARHSSVFSSSDMALPQNMATILAFASMKDQPKSNSLGGEGKPNVTITPSRLSPSLHTENSNNSNSGSVTMRRISSTSPPPLLKENRPQSVQQPIQSVSSHPVDYSRYVKRYSTAMECGNSCCKDLNYREHFHCLDCNSKVFIKKEEMIRHFKWHKKRDESLQHGFMRYSPSDDCSDRFQNCTHNRKQTHYHCIQGTCDKVYISTSDVQMHANYHRKDSAIIQEGFQRLRATEECRTAYCTFFGQRTTHFHCRREHCQFTFKNKADMEKHKTYHIKDEQLARDGFRKFLKQDPCGFAGCRFSQVCNHIHCVRDGCTYVLHSSGQMLSHKRKHERKDNENAYRKFKLTHQNLGVFNGVDQLSQYSDKLLSPTNSLHLFQQNQMNSVLNTSYTALHENSYSNSSSEDPASPAHSIKFRAGASAQLSGGYFTENFSPMDFSQSEESSDSFYRFISYFQANDHCPLSSKCIMYATDHYHCKEANCELPFKTKENAESHARLHEAQERLTDSLYQEGTPYCQEDNCPKEKHFHCTWDGCYEAILPGERLEHLKIHEISTSQFNSLDALFRRKRGRPPKNRIIEVWNDYSGVTGNDSPQAIFTSFKLPKPCSGTFTNNLQQSDNETSSSPNNRMESPKHVSQQTLDQYKFEEYTDGCPDPLCVYSTGSTSTHYHCRRPRCFFATNSEEQMHSHAVDFHDCVEILDGFLFFDSSVDCRLDNCQSNKNNRHFHCVRPGCGFSFVRHALMLEHNNKHQLTENTLKSNLNKEIEAEIKCEPSSHSPFHNNVVVNVTPTSASSSSPETTNCKSTNVVKASGTFYPLCGLSNARTSPPCSVEEKVKSESPHQQELPSVTTSASAPLLNLLPDWLQADTHVRYTTEKPCCRAFCKLKRKDHYHCNSCNQAFSELDKLKQHVLKHNASSVASLGMKQENNNNNSIIEDNEDIARSSALPAALPMGIDTSELVHSPHYPNLGVAMAAAQQLAMMTSQSISFITHGMPPLYTSQSGLMFAAPHAFPHPHSLIGNGLLESVPPHGNDLPTDSSSADLISQKRGSSSPHEMSSEVKKAKIQSSMRMLKDEPVPKGYLRFRFNEDCQYPHCGYREHQTHFHCIRQDCGYSFCDKTRFVQHTARHERLDTLMGDEFQQYRANVACGRAECTYTASLGNNQNKASHFHCLKCSFVCTDTNKVVAHRRQHQKQDSINAAGFEKFTPSQACNQPDTCVYSGKQTHYHCLVCHYGVLGLSQMTSHKYRHME